MGAFSLSITVLVDGVKFDGQYAALSSSLINVSFLNTVGCVQRERGTIIRVRDDTCEHPNIKLADNELDVLRKLKLRQGCSSLSPTVRLHSRREVRWRPLSSKNILRKARSA